MLIARHVEGLPPNNASHVLRLVCDERRARAIVDLIVETFDPAETAACAFEEADGRDWAVEVFFGEIRRTRRACAR